MDIFKKYILLVIIAIIIVVIVALFTLDELREIKTPLGERMELVQNCIDTSNLSNQQCMDLHPVDNFMTRPVINTTNWVDDSWSYF